MRPSTPRLRINSEDLIEQESSCVPVSLIHDHGNVLSLAGGGGAATDSNVAQRRIGHAMDDAIVACTSDVSVL